MTESDPTDTDRETALAGNGPSIGTAHDVLAELLKWRADGDAVALATVVKTWGSSPLRPGSLLGVAESGRFEGSVSGGCVEGAVVDAARHAIATGTHALLDFGITDEMAWEVGLACGGKMRVVVEPLPPAMTASTESSADADWLAALHRRRIAKQPCAAILNLSTGARGLVDPVSSEHSETGAIDAAARGALARDSCVIVDDCDGPVFVQPFNPPLRLVIVGAVHIAQSLARIAGDSGYDVTVIDPRSAFATAARFPGVALSREWPDAGLDALGIDSRCAVVTLTHDPKLDDPALSVALRSPAFYVGSLGSRRTQQKRLERMDALGLGDAARDRIHGPVGLDIGARAPAEIAVSIMAEITACLRQPDR